MRTLAGFEVDAWGYDAKRVKLEFYPQRPKDGEARAWINGVQVIELFGRDVAAANPASEPAA